MATYRRSSGPDIRKKETLIKMAKTERTEIQVNIITTGTGEKFVDIRNWYTTQAEPDLLRPSSGGIWIPEAAVPDIIKALQKHYKPSEEREHLQ